MEQTQHIISGLPGVRLINAEYHNFAFPRHFHLEYHIGLLLRGQHRYVCQGERQQATVGDALLMAPEQIHDGASLTGEGYRIRVLALDPERLEQASRSLSETRQGTPRLTSSSLRNIQLQQQLGNLHASLVNGDSTLAQESYLLNMLATLLDVGSTLRIKDQDQGFERHTWARLREWLESRLDQPPSLEELAAFCDLSPWQTLRRFSRHCGLPPHQWLTQLRLERALPRVLRGDPLTEIALQLGFYDQAHFSRLFRRTYGLPPARLRSSR
ncbi:AraC family ligand binding domain-containing protein [Pseudomonas sp. NPDC078700]|uniref:AraC family transcriptional regulator n=1 Tax=Pseudomonas sp. NPDC078700 TaxID=3364424 RepID=UPI0037C62E74